MKKNLLIFFLLTLYGTFSKAQTAMQFSGLDCNGNSVDLFADLDAGKAVVLFYYMPSCGACPPPAQKIQTMASNVMAVYPGMVKGYAYPYQDITTCSYSSSWVSSNGLSTLYAPMDSGATQVAYYGGFGMPTVVLVGGTDHRVMFSTQSFSTSDTTIMRDSILALLNSNVGIGDLPSSVSSINVYPNPAKESFSIRISLKETADVSIDLTDITGKLVAIIAGEKQSTGLIQKQFSTAMLRDGNYFVRFNINGKTATRKLNITH